MRSGNRRIRRLAALVAVVSLIGTTALAAPGGQLQTPTNPMEQPVEIEVETAPGSLKQAPLWKELVQLLEDPYEPVERRPGFGVDMPDLELWSLDYNFLTAEPMRLRPSDGEVSLDQPGALFDPDEDVEVNIYNVPIETRTVIGALVASADDVLDPGEIPPQIYDQLEVAHDGTSVGCETEPVEIGELWSGQTCGYLLVFNPGSHVAIPPDGTVVAVPAWVDEGGERWLRELEFEPDGTWDGDYEIVHELEAPINEEDFFRGDSYKPTLPFGRDAAEVLGKALFWDMQVGSDGVQACGSCHFVNGADNRTVNQINPDSMGFDNNFQIAAPNEGVTTADFPFRKLINADGGAPESQTNCDPCADPNLVSDSNDVMSSMGVSEFKQFVDIPAIGDASFLAPVNGVRALKPDIGTDLEDPIPLMDGFRRVEPRNTPTFQGAAFNLDNFWDSRARFVFNGGSVDGPSDPQSHIFIDPGMAGAPGGGLQGATNRNIFVDIRDEDVPLEDELEEIADSPVRIKFSSLASQALGPPLSNFEMSFHGRNWPKIGKKLLQVSGIAANATPTVTPLANQLVATNDSVLGPFSNQGGSACAGLGAATVAGKPGLCVSYNELIKAAFAPEFWHNTNSSHLIGCFTDTRLPACPASIEPDPFDSYVLSVVAGNINTGWNNTNRFRQIDANFSLFFGLSVQAYEALTIPDDSAFDRFMDENPFATGAIGQAGEQAVLFPTLVPDLVDDGVLNQSANPGDNVLNLIDADPGAAGCQSEGPNGERGFCEDEVLGMDIFMGANLTAALGTAGPGVPGGPENRNPTFSITNDEGDSIEIPVGSNPFARSARCMLCHLGPEQTDHSINIAHGLLKGDAEFEFPTPPIVPDPGSLGGTQPDLFADGMVPAPEAPGRIQVVGGLILSEEVTEGMPQDAVEVEPRDFATFDDPATWWDDRVIAQQRRFSFGDQGIYNIGVRPIPEDIGRGGSDSFGMPLSSSLLSLLNIAELPWAPGTLMSNVDPEDLEATFEETGDGAEFPGAPGYDLQSINPGLERCPIEPMLPEYLAPWVNCLPAGELHPEIDEMAGMAPNVVTPPNGGPLTEFAENMFGADPQCGIYDPDTFGTGSPNFGWGPLCPNNQSGIASNLDYPVHGTWPNPNQVLRNGAFKAPSLRNVAATGPYFHTGSYLTLRQVVDFYMRGGDFPVTNTEHRDPNIMNIEAQAFGFGRTTGFDQIFDCNGGVDDPAIPNEDCGAYGYLVGSFADALPDNVYLYDAMPDKDHPLTPEYLTVDEAEAALVSFLIALTDDRVVTERAPFDHPEIFVPLDGHAPENTVGRPNLVTLSGSPCPIAPSSTGVNCFLQVPASGANGLAAVLPNFLGVLNTSTPGEVDHFDRVTSPTQ